MGHRWSRSLLAVAIVAVTSIGLAPPAAAQPTNYYAAAEPRGNASGTDRANAIFWRDVNNLSLQPGDIVNFLTDTPYPVFSGGAGLTLTKAGSPGAPIRFRGVGETDNKSACATFQSNRSDPYVPPSAGGTVGAAVFALAPGANNLLFNHVCARNVGVMFAVTTRMVNLDFQGNPRVNATSIGADDLTVIDQLQPHPLRLENVTLTNGRQLLEVASGTGIVNGWFANLTIDGFSKPAMRFRASSHNVIQDIDFDGLGQGGDAFQVGVSFVGNTAADASQKNLIRRAAIHDTVEDRGSQYWQGDSVSDEEFDHTTRIESSQFSRAGDGGFDSKGFDDVVVDTTVTNAKRSYRHHCCTNGPAGRSLTLIRVDSVDPQPYGPSSVDHIQATGHVTVRDSDFTGLHPDLIAFRTEQDGDGATIGLLDSRLTLDDLATVNQSSPGTSIDLGNTVITQQ